MSEDENKSNGFFKDDLSFKELTHLVVVATFLLSAAFIILTNMTMPRNSDLIDEFIPIEGTAPFEDKIQHRIDYLRQSQNNINARIDDLKFSTSYSNYALGFIVTFFGVLVTVLVLFLTLRVGRESVASALKQSENKFDQKIIDFEDELRKGVETFDKAGKEKIAALEKKHDELQEILLEKVQTNKDSKSSDDSSFSIGELSDEDLETRKNIAIEKFEADRNSDDWLAIAWHYSRKDKSNVEIARAFEKAGGILTNQVEKFKSLSNASLAYINSNQPEMAILVSEDLIKWGKKNKNPKVIKYIGRAYGAKGYAYRNFFSNTKIERAIEAFDDLINWYNEIKSPELIGSVSRAMVHKGGIQIDKGNVEKGIELLSEVLDFGKTHPDNIDVKEMVGMAKENINYYTKKMEDDQKD